MGQRAVTFVLSVVIIAAAPAVAQEPGESAEAPPEVIAKMFDCRDIGDAEQRLACFDREVARVYEAQASRELVIADREQIKETKRGLFGLKLPKIGLFSDDNDSDEDRVDEISTTLADATRLNNGRYIFTLEDGARWLETESVAGSRRYGAGDTIVIKKAALGSFRAKVNGRKAVRVRRLN